MVTIPCHGIIDIIIPKLGNINHSNGDNTVPRYHRHYNTQTGKYYDNTVPRYHRHHNTQTGKYCDTLYHWMSEIRRC